MAKPMTIPFLLSLTVLLVAVASAQSPSNASRSCSSRLGFSSNLVPFDTSSLSCNSVWSSQDFVLMYQKSGDSTWNFVLSAPDKNGYIGIGFSDNGRMVGSSAVVGWIASTGKGSAKQYYLSGETSSACTPDKGVLKLGRTLIFKQTSRLYLAFELNVSSSEQPKNKVIYAVGPAGKIPGPDSLLEEHVDEISTTIDYASGLTSESSSDNLQTAHGLLGLIGWGVVVPIGILIARYGKRWDPLWFYSHMGVQFVGFGLGVAAIVTGFRLEDKTDAEVDTHKAIGVVILVFGVLQVMAFLARPDKQSKVRKYWNWYHHYVGRAAVVLAVANIFYGLSLADEETSWSIGYGAYLGVWVVVALLLEVLSCRSRNRE